MLNGSRAPSGKFLISVVGDYVALLASESQERIDDYVEVSTISKNAIGDKYSDFAEFINATELFFSKTFTSISESNLPDIRIGEQRIDKYGINPLIDPSTDPETLWEWGGLYTYDPFGTAPIMYISSSSDTDDQDVWIRGNDIDGYPVEQVVTLNGNANVLLTTPLWRVNSMENYGSTYMDGIVYCHTDPTPTNGVPTDASVRAIINGANGRTLMGLMTVPRGWVGLLYRGEVGISEEGNAAALAEYAAFRYLSRRFGKTFTIKKELSVMVSQGHYVDDRPFPDVIPSMTDVELRVESVSTSMGAWGTFDMRLVREDKFTDAYLSSIGQYGY